MTDNEPAIPAPECDAYPTPEATRTAIVILADMMTRGPLTQQPYGDLCQCVARTLDAFAQAAVEKERERCLRVLKLNNDNDAHRYYIGRPEFFR